MQHDDDHGPRSSDARRAVQETAPPRPHTEEELLALKDALEEERRVLELLNETGATLASKLDLQAVVQAVTDAGTQLSGAEFGAFFYTATDAAGKVFTLFTLSGAPREAFERFGHPRRTPLFEPTFGGAGVVRIADVLEDPRYGKVGPHHGMPPGHLPVRSYLAAPVVARSGEVLGALLFGHRDRGVFTTRSERLILHRRPGSDRDRQRPPVRGGEASGRGARASARGRARRPGGGGAREPHQGRVPRHALP